MFNNHIKTCSRWSELTQAEKDRMISNYYSHQQLISPETRAQMVDSLFDEDTESTEEIPEPRNQTFSNYALFPPTDTSEGDEEVIDCDRFEYLSLQEQAQALSLYSIPMPESNEEEEEYLGRIQQEMYDNFTKREDDSDSGDYMEVDYEGDTEIHLD